MTNPPHLHTSHDWRLRRRIINLGRLWEPTDEIEVAGHRETGVSGALDTCHYAAENGKYTAVIQTLINAMRTLTIMQPGESKADVKNIRHLSIYTHYPSSSKDILGTHKHLNNFNISPIEGSPSSLVTLSSSPFFNERGESAS